MMKSLWMITMVLGVIACGEAEVEETAELTNQEKLLQTIEELEAVVIDQEHETVSASIAETPVMSKAEDLLNSYKDYIAQYPDHDKSELGSMVLNAARIADQLAQMNTDAGRSKALFMEACEYYQLAYDDYEDVIAGELALYAIALIYDFELNDQNVATNYYKQLVSMYPETLEGEQAALRLETINLSPEELIEMFNANLDTASTS